MFRFEGFCDDKNVAKVMLALQGMVLDLKMVPVVNAVKAKNGKLVAKTSGDPLEMLMDHIKKNKLQEITGEQVKEFIRGIGRSDNYNHYLLSNAKKAKLLKRKPGSSNQAIVYQVIQAAPK